MKNLHLKITWHGIKSNLGLYVPYVLVCSLMICLCSVMLQLSSFSTNFKDTIMQLMFYGCGIIGLFSVFFLFYASGIISKSRISEYGLYNLLGFSKKNLCGINLCETAILYMSSLIIGLGSGLILSKLVEIIFAAITHTQYTFEWNLKGFAFVVPVLIFGFIFLLSLIKNIFKIYSTNPIKLIKESQMGEKPPKANYLIAILGLLLIVVCFWFGSHPPTDPMECFTNFFWSALGVIVATYMVFIALSVVICKTLQKNKRFYYKKRHFTAISMLAFRMKKNGAGLASTSIFLTIIFIASTLTFCLYSNCENIINTLSPQSVIITSRHNYKTDNINDQSVDNIDNILFEQINKNNLETSNVKNIHTFNAQAKVNANAELELIQDGGLIRADSIMVRSICLDDYNMTRKKDDSLEPGTVMLFKMNSDEEIRNLDFGKGTRVKAIEQTGEFPSELLPDEVVLTNPLYLIIYDSNDPSILSAIKSSSYSIKGSIYFDTDLNSQAFKAFKEQFEDFINAYNTNTGIQYSSSVIMSDRASASESVYLMYGAIAFMGFVFSIVFLISAIIIIYYKQVSEGKEDADRYQIMQKVGMSIKDIKKSVNSQTLIVFMLPIIFSLITVFFAYPSVSYIVSMMSMSYNNPALSTILWITICGTIFYIIVYKITSRAYLSLVAKR